VICNEGYFIVIGGSGGDEISDDGIESEKCHFNTDDLSLS